MRVQIYEEELGEGLELIEQTSRNGEHFYGLRIWLKTCQSLLDHSTPADDDRSAVTIWAKDKSRLQELILESWYVVVGHTSPYDTEHTVAIKTPAPVLPAELYSCGEPWPTSPPLAPRDFK